MLPVCELNEIAAAMGIVFSLPLFLDLFFLRRAVLARFSVPAIRRFIGVVFPSTHYFYSIRIAAGRENGAVPCLLALCSRTRVSRRSPVIFAVSDRITRRFGDRPPLRASRT